MSGMKVIIDASLGVGMSTTTYEPLTDEDIAQQAIDNTAWEAMRDAPPVSTDADRITALENTIASLQASIANVNAKMVSAQSIQENT